ncbi:hypothetical protein J6590_017835 [Homalodisca vitripennis]|nr:hypothetical protein J6590_017835 [Homalodisca vitripennis]
MLLETFLLVSMDSKVQQAALLVCSAYRTVSDPTVLVVAGVIPAKLLARERKTRRAFANLVATQLGEKTRGCRAVKLMKQVQPWVEKQHDK